jgi:acid phosphatase type 7
MKLRTLGLVLFAMALSTGLFAQPDARPQSLDSVPDYWAPWVTKASTHSVTINWHGEAGGTGVVEYATSAYYAKHQRLNKQVKAKTPATYQHVKLAGLKPDTAYIYRVRPSGNADAFQNRAFRTMPLSGPFTFIVISDTQEGPHYPEAKRFKLVADAVATEPDALFILHGGDNARFDDAGRWALYFEAADAMLAKFPIFTAIGNHEHHDINNPANPPTPAVQYNSCYDVPMHYSFDCAGIRFVILETPDVANANGDDPHTSLALAESQRSWLEKQVRNNMLGTFTLHHHPIWDFFSTTSNPNLQPWEDLYHEYSISATFAGHTHDYQRHDVAGIPYFIVGDGGGDCADLVSNDPPPVWYQFGKAKILGYLKVTVYPKSNLAIAQEIFVAWVLQDDDDETPTLFDPPLMSDAIAFPLVRKE